MRIKESRVKCVKPPLTLIVDSADVSSLWQRVAVCGGVSQATPVVRKRLAA